MDTAPASKGEGRIRLCAGDGCVVVAPAQGGRVASLTVAGHELLVTSAESVYGWGAFPMVPFAGRIRRGVLRFAGRAHELPRTMPPHAIHGTLADAAWTVAEPPADDRVLLTAPLLPPWPFRGRAFHRLQLEPGALHLELRVEAEEPMPAWVGWHPWFRRHVEGAAGELELVVRPGRMFVRDAEGLPTGLAVPPSPRPWDDVFADLPAAPRLRWPGLLTLDVESACGYWVIYDEQPHGLCVEPQTAPPDAANWIPEDALLVAPGRPLVTAMTLRWRPDEERRSG
ncbi:MAG: aldose 1-epimerase [Candidatus Limnocylindrales bacterium]